MIQGSGFEVWSLGFKELRFRFHGFGGLNFSQVPFSEGLEMAADEREGSNLKGLRKENN